MKQNLLKYGFVMVLAVIASTGLLWADQYVEVQRDTVVMVEKQHIGTTDTIVLHDTCTLAIPQDALTNKRSFGYDFLLPLFVSVLGAFIALVLTYLLLRPRFEISPIGIQTLNNRVLFVVNNKSFFTKLYSIKAELAYIKYDDDLNDIILEYIDLDMDNMISVLGNKRFENESYYVFHTKSAFIRDDRYEQVRLRVSATNTISNIFDAKDAYFSYSFTNSYNALDDDIRWGKLDGNIFVGIDRIYDGEKLEMAKRIITFNENVTRILSPYCNKEEVEDNKNVWEMAKKEFKSLKPFGTLNRQFSKLNQIRPTINQLNDDYDKLLALYTKYAVLTHQDKDEKEKLVVQMKREVVRVALYMQKSIT